VTLASAFLSRHALRLSLAALAAVCGLALLAGPQALAGVAGAGAERADPTAYVLLVQGSRSSTMSGSTEDLERARGLRRGLEGLLYVRRGGAAYVIRDAATLRQAEAIFAPQQALGARQGELGERQAALGRRQAALGSQQGRLGVRQANATPKEQLALGREQLALGEQQNALGAQQNALGQQQAALGREQQRLAREADTRFMALLEDAMRRGVAQRVD
jgi:bla regulator protein BlaR1